LQIASVRRRCAESRDLSQNAQKLTGNTKKGQILDIVIIFSLEAGKELLKNQYRRHFEGCLPKANVAELTEMCPS